MSEDSKKEAETFWKWLRANEELIREELEKYKLPPDHPRNTEALLSFELTNRERNLLICVIDEFMLGWPQHSGPFSMKHCLLQIRKKLHGGYR